MVMNKAFSVIPGETVTLKIAAGNGKFESEPVVFEIPEAPEAPAKIPEYTIDGDVCRIDDYSFEIAFPWIGSSMTIEEYADKWGYSDAMEYEMRMRERMNAPDSDTILNFIYAEWDFSADYKAGTKFAV